MKYFLYLIPFLSFGVMGQELEHNTEADSLIVPDMPVLVADTVEIDTLSYAEEFKANAIQFKIGLKAGVTKGQLNVADGNIVRISDNGTPLLVNNQLVRDVLVANNGYATGYSAGIFARLIRGSFYLEPEILYTNRVGKFDILDKESLLINRVEVEFTTIDVPVLLGMRFRDARLYGGPVFSYGLSKSKSLDDAIAPYSNDFGGNEIFKKPVLNTTFGLGFEFNRFYFDLRYESGGGKYIDKIIGPNSNPHQFSFTNDQFILSVALLTGR